jgi:hypothetical protein
MRGLFPKLVVILTALALSACVDAGAGKGKPKGDNPVTGGEIEVTSLDAPTAKDSKATKKPASEAPAKAEKPAVKPPEDDKAVPPPPEAPKTKPKPRPETDVTPTEEDAPEAPPAPEAAEAEPGAVKSPTQLACEKKGNIWAKLGESGANYCAKRTKDNGKRCTKATDCEGLCLARSGTCAPFNPLFGCNDTLQKDGSRMTLCIN